jgi:hypothetical protein
MSKLFADFFDTCRTFHETLLAFATWPLTEISAKLQGLAAARTLLPQVLTHFPEVLPKFHWPLPF